MAAHVSDFKQTNEKILLDLINEQNDTSLPVGAVTFGKPVEVVGGKIATELEVTAASGSGYRGSVTIEYNRVPLSFMNDNEPDLVLETEAKTTHGLIDALNTAFGILLTTADITDVALPKLLPNVDTDVTVTATEDTLVWHGSVGLKVTATLIELSTVLTNTEMDGLYPPAAVEKEPKTP